MSSEHGRPPQEMPTQPPPPPEQEPEEVLDFGTEAEIGSPEYKGRDFVWQKVELRRKNGVLRGTLDLQFDTEPIGFFDQDTDEPLTGRALRSAVLTGLKDGKPASVDLVERYMPKGKDVVTADVRFPGYHYDVRKKRAVVPPFETGMDLMTGLHEFGHGTQEDLPFVGELSDLYGALDATRDKLTAMTPANEMQNGLKYLFEIVPELAERWEHDEIFAPLGEMQKQMRTLLEHAETAERSMRKLEKAGGSAAQIDSYRRLVQAADERYVQKEAEATALINATNLRELLSIPAQVCEQDATRRALEWAAEIRELTGVDLLEPEELRARDVLLGTCADDVRRGRTHPDELVEVSSKEMLLAALKTYGADKRVLPSEYPHGLEKETE